MSRGFVKEEDQEEKPIIPPRAALPAGVTNYVTERGYQDLEEEKIELEAERKSVSHENETERRRAVAVIDGKIALLNERISSARIIYAKDQPKDEVRFGATVTLKINGKSQEFKIVGVDEADVKKKRIAFVAPIAKAITGKKEGEQTNFKLGEEERNIEIISINYDD
ncbi:GreA/GreB family elongation factor [Mesonia maritima]|uniref:Transcription elongation factor GreB n=1 Tax=Mesonia maritima TaxID=1793873 RepID=A0ABU1KA51_9FLAO|nr:GreA/GreB family elongation factor [Mesonia maritima]MDR6301917.1 transcription elongation factor GreB [Mesonia maritima]